MGRKKDAELTKLIERARANVGTKTEAETEAWEKSMPAYQIKQATDEVKNYISKQSPGPPDQQTFSFLPTKMTRVSPFFPLSKRAMEDRPLEELTWENPWGTFKVTGRRLSIYDESVLLAVLLLMRKYRTETFHTTRHALCKVMGITPAKDTYRMVWESLDRLTGTKISLSIWGAKTKGKKRKTKRQMVNTILSGANQDEDTGKILITVNPYFTQMYGESFITNLDLRFRAMLAGDITKALYRFYEGQRESNYQCHLLTLAKAINLNVEMETFRLRSRVRIGLRELRKKGFLRRWTISKSDIVMVWKRTCSIGDGKGHKGLPAKA